jgi:sn-glycerol 3-phosphate transport system ATP-binding protein
MSDLDIVSAVRSRAASIAFDRVTKEFPGGAVAVADFSLEVAAGEFMILVGPSGCGKTTALRMLAGLDSPTSGEISIGAEVVNDIGPRDRDIAMVFQNYALYPHMSVHRNLAFGLRQRRTPKPEIERRVREVSEMLGLETLLGRRPAQLSGGQRQRVAIGRALVREPRAFLLDEPLSNLDARLRVEMRAELKRLHNQFGITTVYVTHDQVEAMTLGHRIAVMSDGRLQQVGTPSEVYDTPSNTYVAAFIGSPSMNLVPGLAGDGHVTCGGLRFDGFGELPAAVLVGLRPEALALAKDGAPALEVEVDVIERLGGSILVRGFAATVGDEPPAVVTASLDADVLVNEGDRVRLTCPNARVRLFDPATGKAL